MPDDFRITVPDSSGFKLPPAKVHYHCKKCNLHLEINGEWALMEVTFVENDATVKFSTGPICPRCIITALQAVIPIMEVLPCDKPKQEPKSGA